MEFWWKIAFQIYQKERREEEKKEREDHIKGEHVKNREKRKKK